MQFEGGKNEGGDRRARVPNEGGEGAITAWEQIRRQRLQEGGWKEGPDHTEPAVKGGDIERKPSNRSAEGKRSDAALSTAEELRGREALPVGRDFEGAVTDVPFNARNVRSKRWYLSYSLRALSMLQSMRFGKNVVLNFPETDLKSIYPALETLSRLPYLLHVKFKGKKYVSAREYDRAAKEMLNAHGDVFGKTGALQAVLAYHRAYGKMQAARKPIEKTDKVNLILNMKMRKRGQTRSSKPQGGGRIAVNKPRGETAIPKALQDLPDAPPGLYAKVGYGPGGGGNLPDGATITTSSRYNSQWEIVKVFYKDGSEKVYRRRLK